MIELAVENKIELFLLLAHTTHMCQPLDVGVFGPGQKAWAQQCDLHYAKTGRVMRKEDVVSEYMKARKKAFKKKTIISAWVKCGIRPSADGVSGVDAFTPKDFAPSNNTSTHANLPDSFPTEPPSDFEPWPTQDEEMPAQPEAEMSDVTQITFCEFSRGWNAEDGTGGGGGGQISEDSSSESEGDDDDDDDDDMDEDNDPVKGEGRSQGEWMVDQQSSSSMAPFSCDSRAISASVTSQTGTSTNSGIDPPSCSRSATTAQASIPARTPESLAQTKKLNELIRSPPHSLSKAQLQVRERQQRVVIAQLQAQQNKYKTHAICAHQELNKAHQKANSKKKKGPVVRIENGELLTSMEARERRAVRSAELQQKEDLKAAKAAKKAEKDQAEATRRTEAIRDPTIAFSGSIASKNKADLQLLLATLGLVMTGTNAVLKERLLQYFEAHPDDKQLPWYAGLFTRRTRAQPSDNTASSSENVPPPSTQPIAGPSRTVPQSPLRHHSYHPPQQSRHTPFTEIHPHNYHSNRQELPYIDPLIIF